MPTMEIAQELVRLCNAGHDEEAVDRYYADTIVSIEGADGGEIPARLEGIGAVREKGDWWRANHEVHSMKAEGPFIGNRADQFVVRFELDATPKGGERMQMTEVGIYTVADEKIVQEEFLYLVG